MYERVWMRWLQPVEASVAGFAHILAKSTGSIIERCGRDRLADSTDCTHRRLSHDCRSKTPFLAAALAVSLGACGPTTPNLSVTEATPQLLRSADDLDSNALRRVATVAEENGGAVLNAETVYRQLAAREPNAPEPRIELGRLMLKRRNVDGADGAFREALSIAPQNMDALVGAAQVLLARNRNEEATQAFDRILASAPDNVRAINGKAIVLDRAGRHAEAQDVYRRALIIEPSNDAVRRNLSLSLALSVHRDKVVIPATAD
jgi:Tfp pilus assembly protein PilF